MKLGAWKRVLEEPVTSLALGEPKVAALGADPWIFEGGAWKKIALPDRVRPATGERDDGRIFFGRDDKPRIMGVRHRAAGPSQLYLRFRNGRWAEERGEIAKLRDAPVQAMFGVLGHADPEVVCKVTDDCIIKRRTGWKMIRAGAASFRVELHGGVAWALLPDAVARLDDDRAWKRFAPPAGVTEPSGVWARGDELWIADAKAGVLHHLRAGAWTTEPTPAPSPRGMWGDAANDLWLATATGLCHFDGTRWSLVDGPTGALSEVYGRGGEVWAAGDAGVWMRAAEK